MTPTRNDLAVELTDLKKTYDDGKKRERKEALKGVSLEIPRGSFFGLLGPNGAGKSTIINIMAGLTNKTSGAVRICGHDIDTDMRAARCSIGVVPQELVLDTFFTVRQALDIHAGYYGVPKSERRTQEIIDAMGLTDKADIHARRLSGGMRRRLLIAKALVHNPPVLILDEPTDGLDPNQKHEVRELINAMAARKIIVISTHILEEVDAVCTRAIIIARGRIVADETPETLIHRSRYHNAVTIRLAHSADLAAVTDDLRRLAEVDHTEVDEHEYSVTAFPKSGAALLTVIGDLAGARRWPMENLRLEAGRLDEVFRSITTDEAA